MPVLVCAVRQPEHDRGHADGEPDPRIATGEQATRCRPEERRDPKLHDERQHARKIADPERRELQRTDLGAGIGEPVRERLLRCVYEEGEVARVRRMDDERDHGREDEEDRRSHVHEFDLGGAFLERQRQPCTVLAEWLGLESNCPRAARQPRPPRGRGPDRPPEARRRARVVRSRRVDEDPRLPQGQGSAESARGADRPRSHLQRGRRVAHRRLVLERRRGREHPPRHAARAHLRRPDHRRPALQLHRRSRCAAAPRGGRLERPGGARTRARGPRGAGRAGARGPARLGRRVGPGRGPPRPGRRRARRRPGRRDGRSAARLRRPARRRPAGRGDRARPDRDEPR